MLSRCSQQQFTKNHKKINKRMNAFETYLPVVYPLTQAKLLLYLRGQALHIALITDTGDLYRHIIDDIQEFKEDVGYAFNDTFTVLTLQPHSLHCRTIAKGFSFLVSVPTIGGKPMHRALHKWLSIQAFSELSSCAASHLDTCFFPEDALT